MRSLDHREAAGVALSSNLTIKQISKMASTIGTDRHSLKGSKKKKIDEKRWKSSIHSNRNDNSER